MHTGETEHLGLVGAVGQPGVMQVDALETLKEPAQRRPCGGLALLVGDGLSRLGEPLTQTHLGQLVDQQAERHDKGEGHDALWTLDEDGGGEKERVFQEGEAAFHHALFAIERENGLVRPLLGTTGWNRRCSRAGQRPRSGVNVGRWIMRSLDAPACVVGVAPVRGRPGVA